MTKQTWTREEIADAIHAAFVQPAKRSDPQMARRAVLIDIRNALGLKPEDSLAAAERAD
jgi:hypothetical protein